MLFCSDNRYIFQALTVGFRLKFEATSCVFRALNFESVKTAVQDRNINAAFPVQEAQFVYNHRLWAPVMPTKALTVKRGTNIPITR